MSPPPFPPGGPPPFPPGGQPQESKGGKLAEGRKGPPPPGPPWARAEKPRDFSRAVRDLFAYIGKYRYAIYFGVSLSILSALLTIFGPQYLRVMSDLIFEGIGGTMDKSAIADLAITIVLIYSAGLILRTAEHIIVPAVSEKIAYILRRDLAHKVDQLPLNYYDNSSTGDIMSRLTNDADTIGEESGRSISMFLTAVTMFLGCVVMMFYTSPVLASITVVPAIAGFIMMRMIVKRTHKYYLLQARNLGAMNGLVEEVYYGHDIVKAYNGEEKSRERFMEINQNLYDSTRKTRFITGTMPQMMGFVENLSYVTVCIVGSMLVISGDITYGVIVAFIVYVRMFNQPLLQMSDALASMQSMAASSERVFELLNAPTLEDESHKTLTVDRVVGAVRFDDVSFSYVEGNEIIHHFSLDVVPGEKVAIVGPTGAGKTTIVNLLMRFYEVDSGQIMIDGVSTKDLRREQVHSMFSMVLQDTWLFNGTIRENLMFNKEGVTEEKIVEACKSVGIHDFIMTLKDGYDTVVSDAVGMSAGQRQQITIARAIVVDAPMIIFDEATSSVDTRTEKLIQGAMDRLTDGRTSFIIAHRLSTIKNCDKIMVMKEGRIVEIGTHYELLERKGFYAELYNSQFENCA